MGKKIFRSLSILLVGFLVLSQAEAKTQTEQEIQELKHLIEQQEKSIQTLKQRVQELETKQTTSPTQVTTTTTPPPAETKPAEAPSPAEEAEAKMAQSYGQKDPVPFLGNFDDRQDPAPRPGDYTYDPQYRGFIPIPHTAFMIKFNPKPRVDLTFDNRNSGDDFRFVTAKIPLEGTPQYGGGEQFNANGNGSQLRIDMRAPSLKGNFRFYYQNDFFGSDTSNFQYRLQHLYGQYYNVVAGYTYGVFEDPDVWPNTLDYEGPNATVYARRPLIHYTLKTSKTTNMTFGVEDPDFFFDNSGDPDAISHKLMPDIGFNLRWEPPNRGALQFSTIFRSVGVNGGNFKDDNDFAWGINLGGTFDVTDKDTLQFLGVFGYGVGGMGNDTSFVNSDAAFNTDGDLVALRYVSGLLGYTHKWTPRWTSTLSYGYANLENTGLQPDDAYHFTHYGSWNIVYQLLKRLYVGAEGLYGFREVKNGDNGDVFRAQLSMLYSIFD